jgi:hypothetical protein
MSRPASSSRTAIIAGTLAGLLSAGLAAYYLHVQQPGTPAKAGMRTAPAPAAAPAPLATPASTPGVPAVRTRAQASQALMALPELKAWSARIEHNSKGKARGALIEYDAAPRVVNGKRYWQMSFVENSADAAERWESFLVSSNDGEILVDDPVTDELISLARWRKEYHPMERGNTAN